METPARPRLAVFKLSSCDGCQLALLNLEDALLPLVGAVEIAFFPEASSSTAKGPYDVTLVEGSVTTDHEIEVLREARAQSKFLVTIGACADSGGVQALRNRAAFASALASVYANPAYIHARPASEPVAAHVRVDFALRGCPIDRFQLLELLTHLLMGRMPHVPGHSLCVECKMRGNVCVLVAHGTACLGPVTHAGCGAICPAYHRGCYGCFGPMELANPASYVEQMLARGFERDELLRLFTVINSRAPEFEIATDALEKVAP